MSNAYTSQIKLRNPNVTEPMPGRNDMKPNKGGGYGFELDNWALLNRFLILGSEGGTYYVGKNELTKDNATNVINCIQADGLRVVNQIVDVSTNARAPKQDPALFALALCTTKFADDKTRSAAYRAIPRVCRTGTTLFMFIDMIKDLRDTWSAGLRKGVSKFYTEKNLHQLDLQLVKYRERHGYTHRDAMRLAHPSTKEQERNAFFSYAVGKGEAPQGSLLESYESLKGLKPTSHGDTMKVVNAIIDTGLPREGVPTDFLKKQEVWEALMERMPIGALVRNLGKLGNVGLLRSNMSDAAIKAVSLLRNEETITKSRIHPMQLLIAQKVYASGHGVRGGMSWNVLPKITEALDDAFVMAFKNIEPTGKRFMLGIDVSGSMSWHKCAGSDQLTCAEGAAAMAMVTARTEENYDIHGFSSRFVDLGISPRDSLKTVFGKVQKSNFGSTNCAMPIEYALKHKIPVDVFCIYTDNESNSGRHPKAALDEYRQKTGIPAKLVGISMCATRSSLVAPEDAGMLDIVGFDTATPNIISQFAMGAF